MGGRQHSSCLDLQPVCRLYGEGTGTNGQSGRRAKGDCLGLEEGVVPELGCDGWQSQRCLGEVQSSVRVDKWLGWYRSRCWVGHTEKASCCKVGGA